MATKLLPSDLNAAPPTSKVGVVRGLLRRLSEELRAATNGDVEGSISQSVVERSARENKIRLEFDLFAPRVPYSYHVFTIEYGLDEFPLKVEILRAEVETRTCNQIEDLEAAIQEIFQVGGPFVGTIATLRELSRSADDDE